MAGSFSQSDVAAMLQLAGEVGELPAEPSVRRAHILHGLLRLVGGIHAQCSEADVMSESRYGLALPDSTIQVGTMDAGQLAAMVRYLKTDEPARDPCVPHMFRTEGEVVVRRREDMIDRSWYRSDHYNLFRRAIGAGESLYCHLRTRDRRYFRIGIIRELRDRPYSDRDVQLMQLFHQHLGRLYVMPRFGASRSPAQDDARITALAPRLRPVLQHMLEGDAEKQIASKLGLSRHTVHQYAKVLYRSLGVSTRAELLAQFVERRLGDIN